MNNQGQKINLIYEKSTLESTDILELQKKLTERNVRFDFQQRSIMTCASIDFFVPIIQFVTSESFLFGFTASATWDLFKTITGFAYNKFHNRKTCKKYNDKTVKTPPNIHFDIGNTHLVLPVDIDKDKYEYAIDKFFKYVSSHTPNKITYVWYNETDKSLTTKTEEQIINEEIKKQQ